MTRFLLGSLNHAGPYFHALGEGLTTCALNETTGAITRIHVCSEAENVIWLTRSGNTVWVAIEHYLEPGGISAFAVNEAGVCSRVGNEQSSCGGAICHIALTPDHRTAFVSSYHGGISVHEIDADGAVSAAHQTVTYQGSGSDTERQEKSHPHQATVYPDGGRLYVCDLGADMIWIHPLEGGRLGPAHGNPMPSGTGPRHLVFHPTLRRLYLLGELDARLHVFEVRNEGLDLIASHDTLPPWFNGVPAGAAIKFHPSGKTLLVSNRHSDTITVFKVDKCGDLTEANSIPSRGKTPRDFAISPSGRWLLAVNQDSHLVASIELDPCTGMPRGINGQIFICGSPFCAIFS